jgi:hypothetical protein
MHDDCPLLITKYISVKIKENKLIEVWIAEKDLYLSSNDFANFIKGVLMGWVPFKLDLAWFEAIQ